MSEVDGATLIARSLKQQGIDHLFGVAPSTSLMFSDRKSTRLNSSHSQISYAVFCLKKKNNISSIIILHTKTDFISNYTISIILQKILITLVINIIYGTLIKTIKHTPYIACIRTHSH